MNSHDDFADASPASSEFNSKLPALVHLRGTLLLPGQEYYPTTDSPLSESILHTIPVDEELLIVHTRSSVTLYHLPTQTMLWHIPCFSYNFAFNFQQNLLALTPEAQEGSIVVWDLHTGQMLHHLFYIGGDDSYHVCPNGLAFSPNGRLLAVSIESESGTHVALWDMTNGQIFGALESDDFDITTLAFHPSRNLLAGGSFNNQKIWFWNLDDGQLLNVWEQHCNDRPYALAFNPDGTLLLAAWGDCGLRVWDMEQQQEVPRYAKDLYSTEVTVAPNGQSVAVAVYVTHVRNIRTQEVRIVEVGSWKLLHTFLGKTPSDTFSRDGKLLATHEEHGHIYVWEVATEQLLYTL